mgnify:CR=1 FL=1
MNKTFRRIIAVILCVAMLFSVCVTGGYATADKNVITVSCEEDLADLDRDIPVVYVTGLEHEYYKGLSTETEEDDVRIWGPDAGAIVKAVFKYALPLTFRLLIKDYEKVNEISAEVADIIFGDFACDENGVPNPDTGKKITSDYEEHDGFGYINKYTFVYDWRLDMVTIASQLDEYINYVMELTGSEQVALVAMSMGTAVLSTYLYEYYYTAEDYAERNHIASAIFVAGGFNGVATCEDSFSGNMSFDAVSLMRMMSELMRGTDSEGVYKFIEFLYCIGMIDPVVNYVNDLVKEIFANGFNDAACETIGSIAGFYALMSLERYEETREYIFDTPEKKAKYAKIIENSDYYHYNVQANCANVIQSMLDDGINAAIIAEYGYTIIPITSDNDRMSDGTIATDRESYGATCAAPDGTLGEGYKQAKECACGKNHISADNQIDASTCAFPDITWFGKYVRHSSDARLIGELVDLISYSDDQVTVWTYEEYPQYLVNLDGEKLVPVTAENTGIILPYEETTAFKKLF